MKGSRTWGGIGLSSKPASEHHVQFYSRDRSLLEAAAKFLISALKQGQAAIVLATREHRSAIVQGLKAAGIGLDDRRTTGRYIELDTEEFLSFIMIGGHPDAGRFARFMGNLVVRASRAGDGRTAIFGEAVSVLCSQEQPEAAIELERLWNHLAQKHGFSLLCGYAARDFLQQDHAFERICATHAKVLPQRNYLELKDEDPLLWVAQLQHKVQMLEAKLAERHHSEEALARSEKLASMGRLAASIAHEINSPLSALTNTIYLLSTHSALDATARQYVAMADEELRRAARITKQVLAFYRESPKPERCKMAEVLDDVLELYQPKLIKSNIAVTRDYRNEGSINGYPSEMRQVFANLVGNAMDAMSKGGTINVRVSATRDWASPSRCGVRISIADSGLGISRQNQKSVFHPFFTTKGESGTGLGLWLSRGIVRRHGGRMNLRSRTKGEPRGAVFSIVLPAAGEESQLTPKARSSEQPKIAA